MNGAARRIGQYNLYMPFAAGGMATIHLGRQVGAVGPGRLVAIKRLQEAYAHDPEFRRMFLDEARITSRLDHPNVVRTLDVVSTDADLLIVMELVRGDAFSNLLRACASAGAQVPLPIMSAIVVGALDGLHAAHEAVDDAGAPLHLVHRDVSPHNILVGSDGLARIADFGIAKALGRSHVTRTGEIKGKLSFMAPEQIRGADVDRRADLYGIAVVLWEACTGTRLFAGHDANVMFQVLEDAPAPPSQLRADLPRALDDLVLRGLAKDPSARFSTAFEMARALEAAAPPARAHEVARWVAEVGRDTIDRQSSLIRAAETGKTMDDAATPPPVDRTITGTSSGVSSRTMVDAPTRSSRRAIWLVGAVAGLAGCAGALVLFLGPRLPRAPDAEAPTGVALGYRPVESSAPTAQIDSSATRVEPVTTASPVAPGDTSATASALPEAPRPPTAAPTAPSARQRPEPPAAGASATTTTKPYSYEF